jgi:hypothetical protein
VGLVAKSAFQKRRLTSLFFQINSGVGADCSARPLVYLSSLLLVPEHFSRPHRRQKFSQEIFRQKKRPQRVMLRPRVSWAPGMLLSFHQMFSTNVPMTY